MVVLVLPLPSRVVVSMGRVGGGRAIAIAAISCSKHLMPAWLAKGEAPDAMPTAR